MRDKLISDIDRSYWLGMRAQILELMEYVARRGVQTTEKDLKDKLRLYGKISLQFKNLIDNK